MICPLFVGFGPIDDIYFLAIISILCIINFLVAIGMI